MYFSKESIMKYYGDYKNIAGKYIEHKKYENALKVLLMAAQMQHLFNIILYDREIEDMIKNISSDIVGVDNIKETEECYILYDSVAISNSALSMQYLNALISYNKKFVYIVKDETDLKKSELLRKIAQSATNCRVYVISKKTSLVDEIREIRAIIKENKPKKALLHMANHDVIGAAAWSNLEGVEKFYINHGDEQFWVGQSVLDYCIEFRGMGCYASEKHRNLTLEQCLIQPYYPVIHDNQFQGFDFSIPERSTKIFSGGRFIKVYGENGQFMNIVGRILNENPSVYFIFAGSGNREPMNRFINENGLSERWKVISYRSDLLEVMRHIDIYLGTYPQAGGLMAQYAAAAGVPIVEMNTFNGGVTEDLLPKLSDVKITHDTWDSYFDEIKKLVDDEKYRKSVGEKIGAGNIGQEEFNSDLMRLLEQHTSPYPNNMREIDVDLRSKRLIDAENQYNHKMPSVLCNTIMLKKHPIMVLRCMAFYIKSKGIQRVITKIIKK